MKKRVYVLSLSIFFALTLVACATNEKPIPSTKQPETTVTTTETTTTVESSSTQTTENGTQRVGSDDYGYLDIPKEWLPFKDLKGGDSIQYTDGTGYNIVTLNGYTKEKAQIESEEEFTAEMIAKRIAYHWINNSAVDKFRSSKTTVSGNEAYQLHMMMKSGQHLAVWLFKQEKRVYLISFEGTEEALRQFIPYIEGTWRQRQS